ncbi:MAG: carboxylesterase/lipase family protein [Selenomonadaceae bacterium]|nr:carboxylesterase/lipase family protein [Selenomonadaceae bacterium]
MFEKNFSRRTFIRSAALTTLAFMATDFFCNEIFAAPKTCSAVTRHGTYNGFVSKRGVKTCLGIPYAKPPVGKLRWRAPEPLDESSSEFDATEFGFSPMQEEDKYESASLFPQSEDCLTLNIWTSARKNNLPVMVFIPGGGFVGGGSRDPIYNGENFAATQDVLIVTINYRINVFGFMNFAAVDPNFEDTGYLGLKDQRLAIEWVRENILSFGGDPSNITIFGESAGSGSVMFQMILPDSNKNFHKAIAQSGTLGYYHTFDESAELAEMFMATGGFKTMQDILDAPAEKIVKTYSALGATRLFETEMDYFPTADGKFLPKHPYKALKDGAARDIKLLTGTTAEEYRYWALYLKNMFDRFPAIHDGFTSNIYENKLSNSDEVYRNWLKSHPELNSLSENEKYFEFANQIDWRVCQELTAEYQSAFNDVFFYLFSQKSPNEKLGSCHAIDLPFVFGNSSNNIEPKPSKKLIKQVQTSWANFAATGNPSNKFVPTWQKYSADNRQTMEINAAGWQLHKDLNTQNLSELRGVFEDNLLS